MNINHKLTIGLLAILLSCRLEKETVVAPVGALVQDAEIKVNAKVIYPKSREWASPSRGVTAQFNPPSLVWPVDRKADYSVRLSQTNDFSGEVIEVRALPYAMYNPHQKLATGPWYWQHKSAAGDWSETHIFHVGKESRDFVTPNAQTLLSSIPAQRPRVLAWKSQLEDLRKRARQYEEAKEILAEADQFLTLPLIEEKEAIPTFAGRNARETRRIAIDASRPVCDRVQFVVSTLAQAYILTGDEKYAQTGGKWIMSLTNWDPEGPTRVTDFGDSGILHAMAVGYDSFYDFLSQTQKEELLRAIAARGAHFYDEWLNSLEARLVSNHVWQHILERFFQTALGVKGDLPIADQWLTYIYEIWLANAPKLGHKDGAWSNGVSYFNMNTLTMLSITSTLKEITGVDFMQDEWYYNNPEWLIYAFPPKSAPDAFCNDGYKYTTQAPIYISWADLNGRITGNPYARWYADESLKGTDMTLTGEKSLKWFYIQRGLELERPAPIAKFDLPQARAFREVGVAYMHTDLANTPANLMVAMKSSPYGAYSHTHAEHNCFNLFYGGKPLFSNTGYRPAMGDPHYLADYKNTRGHNGILINDMGQPFGSEAYGWIPRFLHGEQLSYAVGDATNAYGATDANELQEPGNPSNNHADAGLKRFRRHMALLRPSTLIIYDELETEEPALFTFLLQSRTGLKMAERDHGVTVVNEHATAQSRLFSSTGLTHKLTDEFADPPVNWRQKETTEGELLEYQNHWHYQATNREKVNKMRFLAVIQLEAANGGLSIKEIRHPENSNTFTVGDWEIQAEMDAERPARLEVLKTDGSAALCSSGILELRNKKYPGKLPGSSKIVEMIQGKPVFREVVDEAPESIEQAINTGKETESITHSFFVAGPTFTGIIGESGEVVWDSGKPGARDGYVLPNGHVLICWKEVVHEYDADKKLVFTYRKGEINEELGSVVRLDNGNTLISELGERPRLLEVNAAGEIVVEVPIQPETDNAHMQTRMARKLANGNYLVPHLLAFAVKEYNPKGKVVQTFRTDLPELGGREAENWPFTAIRLKNGHTLINLTHGNKVIEVDRVGKVVWKMGNEDVEGAPFQDPCGAQRLPNGHTVIASYGAKEGVKLFEVTPRKEIVWSYAGEHRVHHFQVLTTNGEPLKGTPLK